MKRLLALLGVVFALGVASIARAGVPQTITVDGVNDFLTSNLLDDDRADTQSNCGAGIYPMDLGRVYVTNDANFLYVGIEFAKTCYGDMNLGMAIDIGTAGGNSTDAFGRKIGWLNVPFKPDWYLYDVTPTPYNSYNYEVLFRDTLGTWQNRSSLINPTWGGGSNGLGIVDSASFKEFKLPLATLGVAAGTTMHLEFWVTQEGTTKGPLDALFSDDVQMSRGVGTTYDTAAVVQMTNMIPYTVMSATDNIAPTVSQANAVNFALQANKQFALLTNKVDVRFSEPVDLASSQTAANYAYSGPTARTVTAAVRDAVTPDLVHLTLNLPINANAVAHAITVSNVKDAANNTIVANGTTNRASFFVQNLAINANMALPFCGGTFTAADTFSVEGNLFPLTFLQCDNALLTDTNADTVYTISIPFSLPVDPVTGKGEADLEWKLTAKCTQWENFGGNRAFHITSDSGATARLSVAWSNEDPANYTTSPVDVVFQVNAALRNPGPSDVLTLLGNAGPLSFLQPGVPMLDNGIAPDQVAGDRIYTARVTFPKCSPRNVGWKVDFNGSIECSGQGDRSVYLNDALFSTANPIVLPARGIDRCTVTDKALTVVFRVQADAVAPAPVSLRGNVLPLSFISDLDMANDGAGYDQAANDVFYSKAVTFPDSSAFNVEFKYFSGDFECAGLGNRSFSLDDVTNTSATPVVRGFDLFDYCTTLADVPPSLDGGSETSFAVLRPVVPNPVQRAARFSFDLHRAGRVSLDVYDVTGRRVARVLDAELQPGSHSLSWDGLGANGLRPSAGLYLYQLSMNGERVARRLILTR